MQKGKKMVDQPDVADVAAEVQSHLDRWNPPADNSGMSHLIGEQSRNAGSGPLSSKVDASRLDLYPDAFNVGGQVQSDLPEVPTDDEGNPLYDDMSKKDLQKHAEARGLSQSGNKGEIVERLEADDEDDSEE